MMPIRCEELESLVQPHLDGELAADDSRELERHCQTCDSCLMQLATEERFHSDLRAALAPPPMPAGLRDMVSHALDQEEWRSQRSGAGRRVTRWLLPGAATAAAAAAMLLFVSTQLGPQIAPPTAQSDVAVADEAVNQHMRRPPLEVQGTAVTPWVNKYYRPRVEMPRFDGIRSRLRGARLSQIRGQPAVQLVYDVVENNDRSEVSMMIFDAQGIDFAKGPVDGKKLSVSGRPLWYADVRGYAVVAHAGPDGLGYLFTSADMNGAHLYELVARSNVLREAP
ncbi:MAG: hypothetical protein Tsb0020_36590 [Haliangiales bacterium]